MKIKSFAALMVVVLWQPCVNAGVEPFGPTDEEKRLLPPYCGGPGGGDWKAILGPQVTWNNHTCYGINSINRYYKAKGERARSNLLEAALRDFNYSVEHLSPDFRLMPEIYYYRGVVYKLQGKHAQAVADFLKSLELEPRYTRSVAELSDLYAGKYSNGTKALEVVTEGLRHNPDSKELRRRYEKYGGKPPYPEPYRKQEQAEPKATGPVENAPPKVGTTRPAPADFQGASPSKETVPDAREAKQPQAIDSKSNPWCRFCPEPAPAKDPAPSKP